MVPLGTNRCRSAGTRPGRWPWPACAGAAAALGLGGGDPRLHLLAACDSRARRRRSPARSAGSCRSSTLHHAPAPTARTARQCARASSTARALVQHMRRPGARNATGASQAAPGLDHRAAAPPRRSGRGSWPAASPSPSIRPMAQRARRRSRPGRRTARRRCPSAARRGGSRTCAMKPRQDVALDLASAARGRPAARAGTGRAVALRSPVVCTRRSMPSRAIASSKPKPALTTPIEPTIEDGSAKISSAAQASQ